MEERTILGFGFRQSATFESFESAVAQILQTLSFDSIAVPADKVVHQMLQDFAQSRSLPIIGVPQSRIFAVKTPTQSEIIRKKRKTGSVAEAAALAILHHPASLLVSRCISEDRRAACAVARGTTL